ncbi:MAG: O-antigen ligase family protein [Nostoc sp.]|uniref:O-antigen ligase family protein n=1 Tax=Nostoc sp. TaxID=1180 RepID=UPI002FF5FFCC
MNRLYTLLFSLSIILINPIGAMRGEIWTQPKVFAISLICILNFLMLWEDRESLKLTQSWKINRLLWEIFLGIGLISTLANPFPWRSLLGQEQMGDGLLYWLLIAIFTLSNNLLLRLHPELARSQLQGLVIGGVILAAVAVMTLVGWQWQWINTRLAATAAMLIIPALLLTQTRAGILALLVATIYLLGRQHYKLLVPAILVCLLIIGIATSTRQMNNLPLIKQITSNRVDLWQMANYRISQRPLLGWGMDGFGTAYSYVRPRKKITKVIRLGDFSFDYQDENGQIKTAQLPTTKAHNLILDTTLSVGLLGMVSYLALLGWCLWQVIKSPYRGIEAVFIAYLAFTFTWFECAQFTHLAWWSLSISGISRVPKIIP